MKKGFSVIVNDKDEVIGGRHNEEVEMFQPIKHLSGDIKLELSSLELLVNSWLTFCVLTKLQGDSL